MRRVGKQVIGVILIVLGFLALVTPATPGSWLILVGLEFLGLRLLLSDRLLTWADTHPGTRAERIIRVLLRTEHRLFGSRKPRVVSRTKP
ncbi:MAG TPA: PGPGW domain-containing protein [Sedimentisphaerales bacterium]|nr:PGPGW domain-containing protein [Sedimentisphaerales bacterium]HRS12182.1 PGPGW domain-containing protein [Sedimentisphaerales bacterium]HRV49903.1 PGPGW domain-containing protein [Sedimentisphaerales bacterium]